MIAEIGAGVVGHGSGIVQSGSNTRALSKRSGRLPPSVKTNVEEVIRVVRKIPLPISHIVLEDVQIDIARLNNPNLKGSQYQDPTRLGRKSAHRLPDARWLSVPAVWEAALSPGSLSYCV